MKRNVLIGVLLVVGCIIAFFHIWKPGYHRQTSERKKPTPSAETAPYNLLLITVDTLRADRLGCYGYQRETSPTLDKLARLGALFENAVVVAPFTGPSHASLLTGRYPAGHGALTNGYELSDENVTLAEALRGGGYETGAFVAAKWVLGRGLGFDQGFDTFRQGKRRKRRAAAVNRDLFTWLSGREGERPFFAWVHYYDVHCSYEAPEPFFEMFVSSYEGNLDPRGKCGKPHYNQMKLDEGDFRYIGSLYDGEIRYVDRQIGKLLNGLDMLGLAGRTILVVTSDHGEALGERELIGHNFTLDDREIRAPLIIVHPDSTRRGVRIDSPVELVALFPTLLDLLGQKPIRGVEGRSFAPLLEGRKMEDTLGFSQLAPELGRVPAYSVRSRDLKVVLSDDGSEMIHSLKGGVENRAPEMAETPAAEKMRAALRGWMEKQKLGAKGKIQTLDSELVEQLEALGYVTEPHP